MKPGDKIKAFVQIGLMKKPEWVKGTIIAFNRNLGVQELKDLGFKVRVNHEDECLVEVSGNRLYLERGKIMLWEPLEWKDGHCPAMDQFAEENWESLKESVTEGMKHFFPDEQVRFDDDEKIVYACDDSVSIGPGVMEIKSIARFKEMPTWTVTEYRPAYYGHLQPPDVDEVEVGESRSSLGAARILIDSIWKDRADGFWESKEMTI